MDYYQLICETCPETFTPVLATSEMELLRPDWDEVEAQAGPIMRERFQDFHSQHRGHYLRAILEGTK